MRISRHYKAKLERRLAPYNIDESLNTELETLLTIAANPNCFNSAPDLKLHLTEGSLLNVTTLASQYLSIPSGEYVVWTTPSKNTLLVPTTEVRSQGDFLATEAPVQFEISTAKLLGAWNKLERVIAETRLQPSTIFESIAQLIVECKLDPVLYIAEQLVEDKELLEEFLFCSSIIEADPDPAQVKIASAARPLDTAIQALHRVSTSVGKLRTKFGGKQFNLEEFLGNIINNLRKIKVQAPKAINQRYTGQSRTQGPGMAEAVTGPGNLDTARMASKAAPHDSAEAATAIQKQAQAQADAADKDPKTGKSHKQERKRTLQQLGQAKWDPRNNTFNRLSGKLLGGENMGEDTTPPAATGPDPELRALVARFNREYPLAGPIVDGRAVRKSIPNTESIGASLEDYYVMKGVRDFPIHGFGGAESYYNAADQRHVRALAEQIRASNQVNPVIIVEERQGPYVLEGGHRISALVELKAKSIPALIVLDLESLFG